MKASTATKRKERIDQFQALQYLDDNEKRALADARLVGALERKKERERARAAAAGRHYQMVIERVEEMKARGRTEAAARRVRYDERLKEAARRRGAEGVSSALATSLTSLSSLSSFPSSSGDEKGEGREEGTKSRARPRSLSGPSEGRSERGLMSYEEAVGVLWDSGIHSLIHSSGGKMLAGSPSSLSPLSAVDGQKAIHPPPMNHSSVTMPFDRFAELIADRRMLLATQRVLTELLAGDGTVKVNARVFLSAYMIFNYPDVVLSGGAGSAASVALDATQEARLAEAAGRMIRSFGSTVFGHDDGDETVDGAAFVSSYVAYLAQFMTWKSHDAAGLENDLIKAAVELESSRLVKLGELTERLAGIRYQVDVDALVQGVDHDLMLIEERIVTLTGSTGVARLKAALEAVKTAHEQTQLVRDRERNAGVNDDEAGFESHGSGTSSLAASPLKTSPLRKMSRREVGGVRDGGRVDVVDGDAVRGAVASGADRQLGANLNLNLMWYLLYDPKWRMPTRVLELQWEESLGGTVNVATLSDDEARSLAIERRFWDDLEASLLVHADNDGKNDCEGNKKFISVVKVLTEVVSKLEEHDRPRGPDEGDGAERRLLAMQESLLPKASNAFFLHLPAFLEAIEWCSNLVLRLCAPARDAEIRRAQRIVGERFQAVNENANVAADSDSSNAPYVEKAVSAIVQSLRILQLQTRILSMDIANAHLDRLTSAMSTVSLPLRIQYARNKMAEELGMSLDGVDADVEMLMPRDEGALRSRLLSCLGNTRGWIAVASGRLPRLETALNGAPRSNHHPRSSFPIRMRTGTAGPTGPHSPAGPSMWLTENTSPKMEPIEWPHSKIGWRGLVRVGLVQLISGDGAIGALSIPETLVRDVPRLLTLQNEFQKCTVLAICMTVIQGAIPVSPSSTGTSGDVVAVSKKRDAKGRIAAILGDPDVSIDHIAAEVTSCMVDLNYTVESFDALQLQVLSILKTLVHRSSTDGRVLVEHLANMITSVLVSGNDDPSYVYDTCNKIGAAEIADDVVELGRKIGEVAAVSEAVCGGWYAEVSAEFIR